MYEKIKKMNTHNKMTHDKKKRFDRYFYMNLIVESVAVEFFQWEFMLTFDF